MEPEFNEAADALVAAEAHAATRTQSARPVSAPPLVCTYQPGRPPCDCGGTGRCIDIA